ncbi:MAG: efflux RND transporter permease subunit [Aquificota bacterium]|nr:efflux RND transporter permease subunit [Aquificota bacterium]
MGRAEFSYDEVRNAVRFNLKSAVALIIYKESKSNTVETAERVWERIEELRKIAPKGVRIDVNYDASVFIKRSVNDAVHEIVVGSLLTALMVFLFLGEPADSTLIPCIRYTQSPYSGRSSCSIITGNSLNMMSAFWLLRSRSG